MKLKWIQNTCSVASSGHPRECHTLVGLLVFSQQKWCHHLGSPCFQAQPPSSVTRGLAFMHDNKTIGNMLVLCYPPHCVKPIYCALHSLITSPEIKKLSAAVNTCETSDEGSLALTFHLISGNNTFFYTLRYCFQIAWNVLPFVDNGNNNSLFIASHGFLHTTYVRGDPPVTCLVQIAFASWRKYPYSTCFASGLRFLGGRT